MEFRFQPVLKYLQLAEQYRTPVIYAVLLGLDRNLRRLLDKDRAQKLSMPALSLESQTISSEKIHFRVKELDFALAAASWAGPHDKIVQMLRDAGATE